MISWNCQVGRHEGCNQFHNSCECPHHPRGAHLTPEGRFSFVDVETYPNATLGELVSHRFAGCKRAIFLEMANTLRTGRHEK